MTSRRVPEADPLSLLPDRLGLPRGRAALPRDEVADSQRGRILQAVVDEVAERGYTTTNVAHIIGRARVSRSAFYRLYPDKQAAFAAAHLSASEQLFELIHRAIKADTDWQTRHRAAVAAYLQGFRSAPNYAISFMAEIRTAGTLLLDQRDLVLERHARAVATIAREVHEKYPNRPQPSWAAIIGAVGGSDELATRLIRARKFQELPTLLEPILELQRAVVAHHPD